MSVRAGVLVAGLFGLLIVGSAYMKSRHLAGIAQDVSVLPPDFEPGIAGFDPAAFEADPGAEDPEARKDCRAGVDYHLRGDDAAAQRSLLAALRREPEWARARFHLGVVRLRLGFPLGAAQDLRRALEAGFEPPRDDIHWWLGLAEIYQGHHDEGRALLAQTTAPERRPDAEALIARMDAAP